MKPLRRAGGTFPDPLPENVVRTVGALDGGPAWLESLPETLAGAQDAWKLVLDAPFEGGSCSWAGPARTDSAEHAVLKVSFPHREARGEAEALRFWDGAGAVRLLRASEDGFALLLEECRPGGTLRDSPGEPDELLAAGLHVLAWLWRRPPEPGLDLESLEAVTADWAGLVEKRHPRLRPGADPYLVRTAVGLLRSLPRTAERSVVLHGDINPGNILAAERAPWLAIDPKPMVGDPGYDVWPLIMQIDSPMRLVDPRPALRSRFAAAAEILGEPADRLAAWSAARAVESAFDRYNIGSYPAGDAELAQAQLLADVAGL
ncbi:aminoglycoside phosphotransferase family protein [Streptomonospora wellingtoniae]|uniref:Aminoglycoside phosphotransferase family protein n=1 Tax=Streptomonospora wellingtoniae TaxID=3075544 RepID=A0ABU2KY43_9ACTN|nr:aminoglycoside phosphotransferase family protein [Streptomonospora sp. DSM 45055]MDT0304167.1 aminoglycoside phosphotransferase family protein [Streptomonospora sp. DSM 45055]